MTINPRYGAALGQIGANFQQNRHTGGLVSPGESYVIGRPGAEELFSPDNFTGKTGRVRSNEDLRRIAGGGTDGGGSTYIVNTQSDRPEEILRAFRVLDWEKEQTRKGRSVGQR